MMTLLVCGAVGVVLLMALSWFGRQSRVGPIWTRAAADLGLPPPSPGGPLSRPSMSGTVDGRHLRVRERANDEFEWIDYELTGLTGLPSGLVIKAGHLGAKVPVLGAVLGGHGRVETGDARFDASFLVTGDDPNEVAAFLTAERRGTLEQLAAECPKFRLKDGRLHYRFGKPTEKIGDVARPARAMITSARVLSPGR